MMNSFAINGVINYQIFETKNRNFQHCNARVILSGNTLGNNDVVVSKNLCRVLTTLKTWKSQGIC